ncbi:uncharacterized protein LOC125190932 isoform X1 [Salvia hispanica]|uniref:uncharacterized protein LOC125190932 isoform X1 n=1 Tax=Salvia hispanica TaxID=49212 RepID=UPI002008F068|nr:uncharacterized protein LOC125190932 isoform X1 [Salvia hispanica]
MNKTGRIAAAAINSQAIPFHLRACLFHSTPLSERRRRAYWDPESFVRGSTKKFNRHQRRLKKKTLLRDVHEFAENLFQGWDTESDKHEQPGRRNSWFRPNFRDNESNRGRSRNRASQYRRRFQFYDDDDDGDNYHDMFRSMFGGNRSFYWSFTIDDDEPHFGRSSNYSGKYRTSSGRAYQFGDEYEEYYTSQEYERPVDGLRTDRLALGLSPSGPINIDDVKSAYRACALKWHPDRHQGSSKVVAEEKFKVCSAAYQSLCDKLPLN